jgi:hypothetical protein
VKVEREYRQVIERVGGHLVREIERRESGVTANCRLVRRDWLAREARDERRRGGVVAIVDDIDHNGNVRVVGLSLGTISCQGHVIFTSSP